MELPSGSLIERKQEFVHIRECCVRVCVAERRMIEKGGERKLKRQRKDRVHKRSRKVTGKGYVMGNI